MLEALTASLSSRAPFTTFSFPLAGNKVGRDALVLTCTVSTDASLPPLLPVTGKEKLVNVARLLRLDIYIIWQQEVSSSNIPQLAIHYRGPARLS